MSDVKSVGRVRYIEPTLLFTSQTGDMGITEIAPPLEDYCIWAELICYSPSYIQQGKGPIKVTYINKSDSTFVSFMNGSGRVYQRADGSKDASYNYLSTDPYDFTTIQDLKKGISEGWVTNECFGINSINIDYDSYQVPQVTIEFTDIRGASLFGMEELSHPDPTTTSLQDNTSGSFFKCFFTFPYPRFYLQVKGFYGQPVSYDLTCYDFKAKFDYHTGNFGGTARFVGYSYGILNDIPLTLAVVAPNTEKGRAYWNSRVADGAFTASNGSPLITFTECLEKILEGYNGTTESAEISATTITEQTDINTIDTIFESIITFRQQCVSYFQNKGYKPCDNLLEAKKHIRETHSSDISFMVVYDQEIPQKGFAIFLSSGFEPGKEDALFDKTLKPIWEDINIKLSSYKSLTVPDYPKCTSYLSADEYNWLIPSSKLSNLIGKWETCVYFNFSQQYSSLQTLRQEKEKKLSESIESVKKERMNRIGNAIGFYPSIKNITKILIAHIETLIKIIMDVEIDVESMPESERSVITDKSSLAMISGLGNLPFPTLTSASTEGTVTRDCECWMGALENGPNQPEVKFIEEMIQGVEDVGGKLNEITAAMDNLAMISDNSNGSQSKCAIYACDLFHHNDYWGTLDEDYGFADLIGRVMMRIVLNSISPLILGTDNDAYKRSGMLDALNFKISHPILSDDIRKQLSTSASTSINNLIKIVNGDADTLKLYGKNGTTYPWSDKLEPKNRLIFSSAKNHISLPKGVTIYPQYDFNFSDLSTIRINSVNNKNSGTPNEQYAHAECKMQTNDFGTHYEQQVHAKNNIKIYKKFSKDLFVGKTPQISEEYGITEDIVKKYEVISSMKIDDYKKYFSNKREVFSKKIRVIDGGNASWKKCFDSVFYNEKNGLPKDLRVKGNIDNQIKLPHEDIGTLKSYDELSNYTTLIFPSVSYKKPNSENVEKEITQKSFDTIMGRISDGFYWNQSKYERFHVVHRDGDNSYAIGPLFRSKLMYCPVVEASKKRQIALVILSYYNMMDITKATHRLTSHVNDYAVQVSYIDILTKGMEIYFRHEENDNLNDYDFETRPFVSEFLEFANSSVVSNFLNEYRFKDEDIVNAILGTWDDKSTEAWTALKKVCGSSSETRPYLMVAMYDKAPVLINNEKNPSLQALFNELFQPCLVVWGYKSKTITKDETTAFYVDKSKAQLYVDSFFNTLRALNGIDITSAMTSVSNGSDSSVQPTLYTDEVKLSLYRSLQSLYKRWLMGGTMPNIEPSELGERWREWSVDGALFKNWYFLDTYYTDIGDLACLNLTTLFNLASNLLSNPQSIQFMSFISALYKESNFAIQCVQNFLKWSSSEVENNLNCIFKNVSYHEMDKTFHPSAIVAMWSKESEHGADDKSSGYKDDGFYFDRGPLNLPTAMNNSGGLLIPAFGVSVGKQYQHYFTDISVSTETPTMTDISMSNMFAIANSKYASKKEEGNQTDTTLQVSFVGQDLFNIYANQSYSCQVSMMGCCWIQPLMYFQLNNVAMFKGAYMIQKVNHSITPGRAETTFSGQRMCKYQPPYVSNPIMSKDGYVATYANGVNVDLTKLANIDNDCPYKYFEPLPTVGSTPFTEEILNMTLRNYESYCGKSFKSSDPYNISIFDSLTEWEKEYGKLKDDDERKKHKQMDKDKHTVMDLLGCVVATEFGGGSDLSQMAVLNQIFNRAISSGGNILFIAHGQNAVGDGPNRFDLYETKKEHFQELIRKVFLQSPIVLIGEQTYVNPKITNNDVSLPNGGKAVAKTLDYLDVSTVDGYVSSQYYWSHGSDNLFKKDPVYYDFRHDEPQVWGKTYVKGLLGKGSSPYWLESDFQQIDNGQEYTISDLVDGIFTSLKKSLVQSNSNNTDSLKLSKNVSKGTITSRDTDLLIKSFDCLNQTYRKYLSSLVWYCKKEDGMGGNLVSIGYECTIDTASTTVIGMKEEHSSEFYDFKSDDTINDKFLLSLKKRYGTLTVENSITFHQECKNFGTITSQSRWEETVNSMMNGKLGECVKIAAPNIDVNCSNPEVSLDESDITMAQLTASGTALKYHVSNDPTPEHACNLVKLAVNLLDPIKKALKKKGIEFKLSSAYRSKAVNDKLNGSSKTSQHMLGEAADISASNNKTTQIDIFHTIAQLIKDGTITVGQLLEEERGDNQKWVHVSLPTSTKQNQIMIFRNDKNKFPGQTLTVDQALKWNATSTTIPT